MFRFQIYPKRNKSAAKMSKADAKGEKFMKKADREKCWSERDRFWDCMKANGEDIDKCVESRKGFVDHCPPTWVKHFDRKFDYLKFKAEIYSDGVDRADKKFTGNK